MNRKIPLRLVLLCTAVASLGSLRAEDQPNVKPADDGSLVDFAALDPASYDLRFASVAAADDGKALTVDFELNPKWPSVEFYPSAKGVWDLSGYTAVEIAVTNESPEAVKTFAYAANESDTPQTKKRQGAKSVEIKPGATETLAIPLTGAEGSFDPAQTRSVRIFVAKITAPVKFKLHGVKATK